MKFKFFLRISAMLILWAGLMPHTAFAQGAVHGTPEDITLWQFIQAGGWAMLVLGVLSLIAAAIIIYDFMMLKSDQLVPTEFTENLIRKLDAYDLQGARQMCEEKPNIISSITLVGMDRRTKGKVVTRESMENTARKEIGKLWQNIAYLGDIATIAPLLGLLGTVLGMIQAFNVISYAGFNLKPIMLVGGISKALVCTAAGLVIAIPCLSFYSYFRGKVQAISDTVEAYASDIMKLIEEPLQPKKNEV